jgi:hypothetical protein
MGTSIHTGKQGMTRRLLHETLGFSWLVTVMGTVLVIPPLYAQQLPDAEWMAYFNSEDTEPREFKVSIITMFGPQEFTQRVKPKGTVSIEGKQYRKSVVLHDSGPYANQTIEMFVRISDDGFYERKEDGSDVLLVPRPLVIGQSWVSGNETLKLEGIEDFETFNKTIPACLKITASSKEVTTEGKVKEGITTKYYERRKGLIYKSGTGVHGSMTKIIREYAGAK